LWILEAQGASSCNVRIILFQHTIDTVPVEPSSVGTLKIIHSIRNSLKQVKCVMIVEHINLDNVVHISATVFYNTHTTATTSSHLLLPMQVSPCVSLVQSQALLPGLASPKYNVKFI
jgi:hypothetical protein